MFGLAFAGESIGLYVHELDAAAAVTWLLLGAVTDPTSRRGVLAVRKGEHALGIVLAVVGLACVPLPTAVRFFAIAIWFDGVDRVGRSRSGRVGPAAALALGSLLFGIYTAGAQSSLLGWYAADHTARALSTWGTGLVGRGQSLGPTFAGLDLFVMSACVCLGGLRCPWPHRWVRSLMALPVLALISVGSLALFALAPDCGVHLSALIDSPWALRVGAWVTALHPLHMAVLPAVAMALVVASATSSAPAGEPSSRPWRAATPLAAACALLATAALTNLPATPPDGPRRVALYEKGFLNWLSPTHQRYGSRSGGMFGNLPGLLERLGWQSEFVDRIDAGTLADRDLLVIINQHESLPEASRQAVEDFVHAGGALLVLGDHTFYQGPDGVSPDEPIEGQRLQLNEPLRTTDIAFAFDSAYYFIGGWLHSVDYAPHWVVAGLGDATNEAGLVVGASLEVRYPAAPLVVGRYGFSDPGVHPSQPTARSRGFMQSGSYDPGEVLGDRVLAAVQEVGAGRVAVLGDTSSLVNVIQSQTWPFAVRLFHWLGGAGHAAVPAWRDGLGLALLVLVGAMVVQGGRGALLAGAVSALLSGVASQQLLVSWVEPPPLAGRVALVDLSHVGRHSIEGWRERGVSALYLNLMRSGFHTLGMKRFDAAQLAAADLLVTVAPTAGYDPGELDAMWAFMQDGGTILLATGYEEQVGSTELLERAGLTVAHRPLGREPALAIGAPATPTFFKSWPVLGADEALVEVSGEPVVTRTRIGRGQLVVIGDGDFLLNRNVEVEDGAILHNVRFLSWLFAEIAGGEAR